MLQPYVLRIVSTHRKVGKTLLGTKIVKELLSRGIKVAVIKHAHGGIKLEGDSGRYLTSGANYVVLTTDDLIINYLRVGGKSLKEIINSLPRAYGLVLAEGFKGEDVGDAVLVVNDLNEVREGLGIVKGSVIAAYLMREGSNYPTEAYGLKVLHGELGVKELIELIINKAINYLSNQLPKLNCGLCGFRSCEDLVRAYLLGSTVWCPRLLNVELVVNGTEVRLVPFVKEIITRTLLGMVTSLKGVPKDVNKIKEVIIRVRK